MLIRDDDETRIAIGQPAHASVAAQLANAWSTPLPHDVILATAQHDIAWSEWDLRPPLHAEARRAAAFFEAPLDERIATWERVDRRLEAQSPYAALLVSLHATNIHTRYGDPDRRPTAFLERTHAAQDELIARLAGTGVTRERAEADADLVFGFDALSLTLCLGRTEATVDSLGVDTITIRVDGDAAIVDPWPFAPDELTVTAYARRFTERFDDEGALHRAMEAAPYERLEWHLTRA
ncbi:MAG: hypothetical protein JWL76_463 [Thermoleophilia bacterium]|nr:hypothetical protein [Thermoleophilia bacterium]